MGKILAFKDRKGLEDWLKKPTDKLIAPYVTEFSKFLLQQKQPLDQELKEGKGKPRTYTLTRSGHKNLKTINPVTARHAGSCRLLCVKIRKVNDAIVVKVSVRQIAMSLAYVGKVTELHSAKCGTSLWPNNSDWLKKVFQPKLIDRLKLTGSTLSSQQAKEMVEVHNKWRRGCSKFDVHDVVWSTTLAKTAQEWANKLANECKQGHSKLEWRKHDGNYVGENCFYRPSDQSPGDVINKVCEQEKEKYLKSQGDPIAKSNNLDQHGHYTQIVWKETQKIGCGRAKDKNGKWYWICHYLPAGNTPEWKKHLIPRDKL